MPFLLWYIICLLGYKPGGTVYVTPTIQWVSGDKSDTGAETFGTSRMQVQIPNRQTTIFVYRCFI